MSLEKNKKDLNLDILKKDIKDNALRNMYLFYGPEEYLIKYYINVIKDWVFEGNLADMNYLVIEEGNDSYNSIVDFCDTPPIMSDKKMLIIKKTSLQKGKRAKAETSGDQLIKYLEELPKDIYIIFIEGLDVDKRTSFYKMVEKHGLLVKFDFQPKGQLVKWVSKILKESGKIIDEKEALYLIDSLDPDMQSILNECNKLISYLYDKDRVTMEDIDKVCTKSLSSKVFEMADSMAQKNLDDALAKLSDLVNLKEPMAKILILIASHIRKLLQLKVGMKEGYSPYAVAKEFDIYYVEKYVEQCKNFEIKRLEEMILKCAKADLAIKSTAVDERIILEELIVEIAK